MRRGGRPQLVGAALALCLLTAVNISISLRYTESHRPTVGSGARDPLLAAGSSALPPLALVDSNQAAVVAVQAATAAALTPRATVWLRIVMPCHSRTTGVNYLRATLAAILLQLPPGDPLRALVDVLVVNTDAHPADNKAYADVRAELAGEPLVRFAQLDSRRYASLKPRNAATVMRRVKASVQQQTIDLAEIFAVADAALPRAELVMAAEDDWLLCPNGLLAILHLVRTASALDPHWIALRCSYGFNGIVLRAADLPSLVEHLAAHFVRRPPDHLVFEWFSGEWHAKQKLPGSANAAGRSYRTYRHNLFYHIGHISTLSQPSNRFTPRCYELLYDWLLPAETFKRDECPASDVWPCTPAPAAPSELAVGLFEPFSRVDFAMGLRDREGHVPAGAPDKARVLELTSRERRAGSAR